MLQNTRGIVFQQFKYSESSIIVKIYTEHFGLQSYIVKGIRSRRSKTKPALFQPLNLLELVVYHKENKSLHHLKEVKVAFAYQSIPNDVIKRSLLFFLTELLYKSIREESADQSLFSWLFNALTWFDLSSNNIINFHLVFMMQLTRFLGFYPKKSSEEHNEVFDLQEGLFAQHIPEHPNYVTGQQVKLLTMLHDSTFEMSGEIPMSNKERRKLLELLVFYFKLHQPGFGDMKSVDVLKSVFD